MSVLESIFEGKEVFENIDFRSQRDYRTLSNKLDNMERKFLSQLSETQVEEFEELLNMVFNLSYLEKKTVFKAAVSYGAQLMNEVYNTKLFEL